MADVMDGDRSFRVGEADVVQLLKIPAGVAKTGLGEQPNRIQR